jgi:hypothetical protein
MPSGKQEMLLACLAALIRRTGTGVVVIEDADVIREMTSGTAVALTHDARMDCVRLTVPEIPPEAAR